MLPVCLPRCMMPLRCGLSSTILCAQGNWTYAMAVTGWCFRCLAAGPLPVAGLPYQVHPLDLPDTLSPASICFESRWVGYMFECLSIQLLACRSIYTTDLHSHFRCKIDCCRQCA